jgi:glycosyltransferase involved in cell wall biosynthesis
LRKKYANHENLILHDPIYEQKVLDEFRSNCFFYIHGHSAGGTNPSLVEAMHLGLPIISFGVSYNRSTTEDKAVYFNSSKDLEIIFKESYHINRDQLMRSMKSIANRKYTWNRICQGYKEIVLKSVSL